MEIGTPSRSQNERPIDGLARASLLPGGRKVECVANQEMQHNTSIIVAYLDQVPEFHRLAELRRKVNHPSLPRM